MANMEKKVMKVREFLALECDVDISDDIEERVCIAFCGPCALTEEGEKIFAPIMDCEVYVWEGLGSALLCLDKYEDWEEKLDIAELLFNGFAGYISETRWYELFKEED